MKNIRFLIFPVLLAFVLFSCENQAVTDDDMLKAKTTSYIDVDDLEDGCSASVDLIAAQHYYAGQVNVTKCGDGIKVQFVTENSWILTEVHVDVQNDPNDFPMTNSGNPKVGNFYWNVSFDPSENKTVYETDCIPVADGDIYVAAHAVVCGGMVDGVVPDYEALCESIPEFAKMENQGLNGSISYNKLNVYDSGDEEFDGIYNGWCIEQGVHLYTWEDYEVKLLCSLGDLSELEGRIIITNFDLINFILNQNYIGYVPEGLGAITVADVQMAIWELVMGAEWTYDGDFGSSDERVDWILAQAAGHEGYMPGCGGVISVILLPTEIIEQAAGKTRPVEEVQLTLITIPVPCYGGCETAWGKGYGFPGNQWAMFFEYCEEVD